MFRSIRARLTLWYTLIVAVIFVFIAVATYRYVSATLYENLDLSLVNEAKRIASRLDRQKPEEANAVVINETKEHSAYYPMKEYVEVWTPDGRLFCRSSNIGTDSLVKYVSFTPDSEVVWTTVSTFAMLPPLRMLVQKSGGARIVVGVPVESVEQTLEQLVRVMAWMGPLVVLLAFVGGLFLAKKSLSKVNQVTEIARKIS